MFSQASVILLGVGNITWSLGYPTPPNPHPEIPYPPTDIWWSSLETYSNLFTWGHPQWYWNLVVATEAGSMHPIGMLSCLPCAKLLSLKFINPVRLTESLKSVVQSKISQYLVFTTCLKYPKVYELRVHFIPLDGNLKIENKCQSLLTTRTC